MKVTTLCFGRLKDDLPEEADRNKVILDLPDAGDVSDAIAALGLADAHVFVTLVNGERSDRSTQLREGDEVTFMPPFSGG